MDSATRVYGATQNLILVISKLVSEYFTICPPILMQYSYVQLVVLLVLYYIDNPLAVMFSGSQ